MFVFDPKASFKHKVNVLVPVDGGHEEQSFEATFVVVPTDRIAQFDLSDSEQSAAFLREAIASVGDVVGPDKKPVVYSDKLRDALIAQPHVRTALARTYFEAVIKAQQGN